MTLYAYQFQRIMNAVIVIKESNRFIVHDLIGAYCIGFIMRSLAGTLRNSRCRLLYTKRDFFEMRQTVCAVRPYHTKTTPIQFCRKLYGTVPVVDEDDVPPMHDHTGEEA